MLKKNGLPKSTNPSKSHHKKKNRNKTNSQAAPTMNTGKVTTKNKNRNKTNSQAVPTMNTGKVTTSMYANSSSDSDSDDDMDIPDIYDERIIAQYMSQNRNKKRRDEDDSEEDDVDTSDIYDERVVAHRLNLKRGKTSESGDDDSEEEDLDVSIVHDRGKAQQANQNRGKTSRKDYIADDDDESDEEELDTGISDVYNARIAAYKQSQKNLEKSRDESDSEEGIDNSDIYDVRKTPQQANQNKVKKKKKGDDSDDENGKKPKIKQSPKDRQEQEERTIFVGNVNTKVKRKQILSHFSKYGKIESVRLRGAAVAEPQMTKKHSVITGSFHEKRTSLCAYVRFTEKVMMEAALKANGSELMKKHLNVDRAVQSKERANKLAVFVGNLSFEAEEEDLRGHFADCGDIESVRIIRDKKLGSGKGFGYVNFQSTDAIEIALRLNNRPFMGRQLRVQRCQKKSKTNKLVKKKVKKVKGHLHLGFLKAERGKLANAKKAKLDGNFSGKKMLENKKFKKMKKKKGRLSKEDRKKFAVARQLTGLKPSLK